MTSAAQLVNPLDHPSWDDWVSAWEEASPFHGAAWCRTLVEAYGYRPCYAVIRQGDGLRAVLPMMEVRGWSGRRRGLSLPFSDFCEPLQRDGADGALLREAVQSEASARGWRTVEFRGPRPAAAGSELPALSFYAHEVDLAGTEEDIWARCTSAARRAVRKARASGLEVTIGCSDEEINAFYHLFTLTRRRHGLPPPPRAFFRQLQRHMLQPGLGVVVTARQGGLATAASVFLRFGRRGLFKYGASDPRYQAARPNNLVMWEGLRWCRGQGCRRLSLGKTRQAQNGLRGFKMGWGAREETLDYFVYDVGKETHVRGRDDVDGWYNAAFRRMPLPVLRWVGRLLYSYAA